MPKTDPISGSGTPTPVAEPTGAGRLTLLIEDEVQIRRFLRIALASQGFRLFEAATGEEGLVAAATQQPDIIILDLGLPDVDGTEIIRRVRE
jgi:two-component system KDP operon response regulator KdpE